MAISDKIQQVMKERNISYAELSRMTGIAPSSMQSYGSGRSKKIPFHVIETLSEKLHLPIEFWLGDEQIAETRVSHELAEEVRIHLFSFCRGISRLFVKESVKDGIKKEALRRVPERRKTEMKIVALFSKEPM